MKSEWIRVGLNPITGVFINIGKFKQRHRERMLCNNESRDWSDTPTNKGIPKIAGNCQRLGKRDGTDSPPVPPEGNNPAKTLILNFQLPETVNIHCFKLSSLWLLVMAALRNQYSNFHIISLKEKGYRNRSQPLAVSISSPLNWE